MIHLLRARTPRLISTASSGVQCIGLVYHRGSYAPTGTRARSKAESRPALALALEQLPSMTSSAPPVLCSALYTSPINSKTLMINNNINNKFSEVFTHNIREKKI